MGGKDGRNVNTDSYEASRVYNALKKKFGSPVPDSSSVSEPKADWAHITLIYAKAKAKITGDVNPDEIEFIKNMLPGLQRGDSAISKDLGKEYSCKDLSKLYYRR